MPERFFRSALPDEHREMPKIDTSVAHVARVYDYWLGGKDNFAADREVGDKILAIHPETVLSVQANRRFLARSVRYLAHRPAVREQHARGRAGHRPRVPGALRRQRPDRARARPRPADQQPGR
jgi:hypothetical protein